MEYEVDLCVLYADDMMMMMMLFFGFQGIIFIMVFVLLNGMIHLSFSFVSGICHGF